MPRRRGGPESKRPSSQNITDSVPAPYNYLYTGHDPEESRLVSALMLAGETLAGPLRSLEGVQGQATHALPEDRNRVLVQDDFEGLHSVVAQITDWVAGETWRRELLSRLREGLASLDALPLLGRGLVPRRDRGITLSADGAPVLSRREVEVLREMAADISHQEIGERLGITAGTVHRHLVHIYRKLGVSRPFQAVARAIVLGYLPYDTLDRVGAAAGCYAGDFGLLRQLVTHTGEIPHATKHQRLQALTEFALLLLVAGNAAARVLEEDARLQEDARQYPDRQGLICLIDPAGKVVRTFGRERLRGPLGLALAPPSASRYGFAPGHLFVSQDMSRRMGLNMSEVLEFTPEGDFVRSFCGAQDIDTRLVGGGIAFTLDGRLLVTNGDVTDALLAFTQGGRRVRRFAEGCCNSICVGPSGEIYMPQVSVVGSVVKVFTPDGRLLRTIGGTIGDKPYSGIAVSSEGHVWVNRKDMAKERGTIEEYAPTGELLCSFPVRGLFRAQFAVDAQDRLYVPCERTGDVKVYVSGGKMQQRIDLDGLVTPHGVAINEKGLLWVCGSVQ